MMFERFTPEARAVVAHAIEQAARLGHRYVGGEHLLLAVASAGQPASVVLCAHGLTPERVEEEITRRSRRAPPVYPDRQEGPRARPPRSTGLT
jgi:ATP-dependent Clp protease ATP-binding subunit ClpA